MHPVSHRKEANAQRTSLSCLDSSMRAWIVKISEFNPIDPSKGKSTQMLNETEYRHFVAVWPSECISNIKNCYASPANPPERQRRGRPRFSSVAKEKQVPMSRWLLLTAPGPTYKARSSLVFRTSPKEGVLYFTSGCIWSRQIGLWGIRARSRTWKKGGSLIHSPCTNWTR